MLASQRRVLFVPLLLCWAAVSLAGPLEPDRLPASARWVMHADLQRLRDTQLGRAVLERLNNEPATRKFAAFTAIFGFDPRQDLAQVTAFGQDGNEEHTALLLRGRLDSGRLVTLVQANDHYEARPHQGTTIHGWIDEKDGKRSYGAVAADGTVIVGRSVQCVGDALDALAGRGTGADAALRQAVPTAGAGFVVAAAHLAAIEQASPHAAILSEAETAAMWLDERDGAVSGTLTLGARDETVAQRVEAVARGMMALAMLARENNPKLAELVEKALVTRQANSVTFTLQCPVNVLVAYLETEMARQKERQAAEADPQ